MPRSLYIQSEGDDILELKSYSDYFPDEIVA
jgi:hypothetical protein